MGPPSPPPAMRRGVEGNERSPRALHFRVPPHKKAAAFVSLMPSFTMLPRNIKNGGGEVIYTTCDLVPYHATKEQWTSLASNSVIMSQKKQLKRQKNVIRISPVWKDSVKIFALLNNALMAKFILSNALTVVTAVPIKAPSVTVLYATVRPVKNCTTSIKFRFWPTWPLFCKAPLRFNSPSVPHSIAPTM